MFLKLFITILLLICPTLVFAIDQWTPTKPQSADAPSSWPADEQTNNNSLSRLLANYRQSQVLTYSSASAISVSSGEVSCNSATPYVFRQNTSSTTVNAASLDSGVSFTSSTTYYVYANCDASATTNTYTVSINGTSPSGVTNYKQLGSFTTDSSSNIASVVNANYTGVGTAVSKSTNTAYLATTDGELIGYILCNSTGILTIATDSSPSPTTTATIAGCNSSTTSGYFAFSVLIKKGNYYKATSSGSTVFSTSVSFIPSGV